MKPRTVLAPLLTLLLATTALANDGAEPDNFQLTVDGPDVLVSVELTNTGEPRDVDLLRGDDTLTRLEFDMQTAVQTWLVCRNWGFETDCDATPAQCSDCDGDGVNECPSPACDIWGVFEYTDSCVPALEAGPYTWTYTITDEESYSYSESLNVEVTQVDDCQPLLDDPAGDDDDDAGCTSCGVAGESLGGPLTLGLLMLSIGLFGMLAGRRRS